MRVKLLIWVLVFVVATISYATCNKTTCNCYVVEQGAYNHHYISQGPIVTGNWDRVFSETNMSDTTITLSPVFTYKWGYGVVGSGATLLGLETYKEYSKQEYSTLTLLPAYGGSLFTREAWLYDFYHVYQQKTFWCHEHVRYFTDEVFFAEYHKKNLWTETMTESFPIL